MAEEREEESTSPAVAEDQIFSRRDTRDNPTGTRFTGRKLARTKQGNRRITKKNPYWQKETEETASDYILITYIKTSREEWKSN